MKSELYKSNRSPKNNNKSNVYKPNYSSSPENKNRSNSKIKPKFFNKIAVYIEDQQTLNNNVSIKQEEKNVINEVFIELDTLVVKGETELILEVLKKRLLKIKRSKPEYFEVQWFLINMISDLKLQNYKPVVVENNLLNNRGDINTDNNINNTITNETKSSNSSNIVNQNKVIYSSNNNYNKKNNNNNNPLIEERIFLQSLLKLTDYLPGSNWDTKKTWKSKRSHIYKLLAKNFLKENNYSKAIEQLRMANNLDKNEVSISKDFLELYLIVSNQLLLEDNTKEAFKYLKLCENYYEEKHKVNNMIQHLPELYDKSNKHVLSKKLVKETFFKEFSNDDVKTYISILGLLSKCASSTGFIEDDYYVDKKSSFVKVVKACFKKVDFIDDLLKDEVDDSESAYSKEYKGLINKMSSKIAITDDNDILGKVVYKEKDDDIKDSKNDESLSSDSNDSSDNDNNKRFIRNNLYKVNAKVDLAEVGGVNNNLITIKNNANVNNANNTNNENINMNRINSSGSINKEKERSIKDDNKDFLESLKKQDKRFTVMNDKEINKEKNIMKINNNENKLPKVKANNKSNRSNIKTNTDNKDKNKRDNRFSSQQPKQNYPKVTYNKSLSNNKNINKPKSLITDRKNNNNTKVKIATNRNAPPVVVTKKDLINKSIINRKKNFQNRENKFKSKDNENKSNSKEKDIVKKRNRSNNSKDTKNNNDNKENKGLPPLPRSKNNYIRTASKIKNDEVKKKTAKIINETRNIESNENVVKGLFSKQKTIKSLNSNDKGNRDYIDQSKEKIDNYNDISEIKIIDYDNNNINNNRDINIRDNKANSHNSSFVLNKTNKEKDKNSYNRKIEDYFTGDINNISNNEDPYFELGNDNDNKERKYSKDLMGNNIITTSNHDFMFNHDNIVNDKLNIDDSGYIDNSGESTSKFPALKNNDNIANENKEDTDNNEKNIRKSVKYKRIPGAKKYNLSSNSNIDINSHVNNDANRSDKSQITHIEIKPINSEYKNLNKNINIVTESSSNTNSNNNNTNHIVEDNIINNDINNIERVKRTSIRQGIKPNKRESNPVLNKLFGRLASNDNIDTNTNENAKTKLSNNRINIIDEDDISRNSSISSKQSVNSYNNSKNMNNAYNQQDSFSDFKIQIDKNLNTDYKKETINQQQQNKLVSMIKSVISNNKELLNINNNKTSNEINDNIFNIKSILRSVLGNINTNDNTTDVNNNSIKDKIDKQVKKLITEELLSHQLLHNNPLKWIHNRLLELEQISITFPQNTFTHYALFFFKISSIDLIYKNILEEKRGSPSFIEIKYVIFSNIMERRHHLSQFSFSLVIKESDVYEVDDYKNNEVKDVLGKMGKNNINDIGNNSRLSNNVYSRFNNTNDNMNTDPNYNSLFSTNKKIHPRLLSLLLDTGYSTQLPILLYFFENFFDDFKQNFFKLLNQTLNFNSNDEIREYLVKFIGELESIAKNSKNDYYVSDNDITNKTNAFDDERILKIKNDIFENNNIDDNKIKDIEDEDIHINKTNFTKNTELLGSSKEELKEQNNCKNIIDLALDNKENKSLKNLYNNKYEEKQKQLQNQKQSSSIFNNTNSISNIDNDINIQLKRQQYQAQLNKKKNTNINKDRLALNKLTKYFQSFTKFIDFKTKAFYNNTMTIKDIYKENSVKKKKNYYLFIQQSLNSFSTLYHNFLSKKLIFDSYINENNVEKKIKENKNYGFIVDKNLIDDFFYDNETIYKSVVFVEGKKMMLVVKIRLLLFILNSIGEYNDILRNDLDYNLNRDYFNMKMTNIKNNNKGYDEDSKRNENNKYLKDIKEKEDFDRKQNYYNNKIKENDFNFASYNDFKGFSDVGGSNDYSINENKNTYFNESFDKLTKHNNNNPPTEFNSLTQPNHFYITQQEDLQKLTHASIHPHLNKITNTSKEANNARVNNNKDSKIYKNTIFGKDQINNINLNYQNIDYNNNSNYNSKTKTNYKSILEFTLHDITQGSNWKDKFFISWEEFDTIINYYLPNSFKSFSIKMLNYQSSKEFSVFFDIFSIYLTKYLRIRNGYIDISRVFTFSENIFEFFSYLLETYEAYVEDRVCYFRNESDDCFGIEGRNEHVGIGNDSIDIVLKYKNNFSKYFKKYGFNRIFDGGDSRLKNSKKMDIKVHTINISTIKKRINKRKKKQVITIIDKYRDSNINPYDVINKKNNKNILNKLSNNKINNKSNIKSKLSYNNNKNNKNNDILKSFNLETAFKNKSQQQITLNNAYFDIKTQDLLFYKEYLSEINSKFYLPYTLQVVFTPNTQYNINLLYLNKIKTLENENIVVTGDLNNINDLNNLTNHYTNNTTTIGFDKQLSLYKNKKSVFTNIGITNSKSTDKNKDLFNYNKSLINKSDDLITRILDEYNCNISVDQANSLIGNALFLEIEGNKYCVILKLEEENLSNYYNNSNFFTIKTELNDNYLSSNKNINNNTSNILIEDNIIRTNRSNNSNINNNRDNKNNTNDINNINNININNSNNDINQLRFTSLKIKKLVIRLKPALQNFWYILEIKNPKIYLNIIKIFENNQNREKLLKHYLSNLLMLDKSILGDYLSIKSKVKENDFSLDLKKHKSNYNRENSNKLNIIKKAVICVNRKDKFTYEGEVLERVKLITKIYTTKNGKMIFNFKIFNSRITEVVECEDKEEETNLYKDYLKTKDEYVHAHSKININSNSNINNSFIYPSLLAPLNLKRKNYETKTIINNFSYIYMYNPTNCTNNYFFISLNDLQLFLKQLTLKKLKEKFIENIEEMLSSLPKKFFINTETTGNKLCIKLLKVSKIKQEKAKMIKTKIEINPEDNEYYKEMESSWLKTQLYIKCNLNKYIVDECIYDLGVSEEVLIYKTVKDYYFYNEEKEENANQVSNINIANKDINTDLDDLSNLENLNKSLLNNNYNNNKNYNSKLLNNIDNQKAQTNPSLLFSSTNHYKKLSCVVTVTYHKQLEYWTLTFSFLQTQRKFFCNIHQSDLEKIPREYFNSMAVIDNKFNSKNNQFKQEDLWAFLIKHSNLKSNRENNCYFEAFNDSLKTLLKEFLSFTYEILNDSSSIILTELSIKCNNRFMFDDISKVVSSIPFSTELILQSFSFDNRAWNRQVFKIEDFREHLDDFIINEEVVTGGVTRYEEYLDKYLNDKNINNNRSTSNNFNNNVTNNATNVNNYKNKSFSITTNPQPYIVNQNNPNTGKETQYIKKLSYSVLRKLTYLIIKTFKQNKNLTFSEKKETQIHSKTIQTLLEKIGYDRQQQQQINNLYNKKTEILNYQRTIYTEMLMINPSILASVVLNSSKKTILIKLFYTKKNETHFITVSFSDLMKIFFPFLADLVSVSEKELGKRILEYYKDLIMKNSSVLKLFKFSSVVKGSLIG